MKQLILGMMAHVDSGKTSLSEAMLYTTGTIQKLGRVDHKDAYLDTHSLERARGITIFSKQARFSTEQTRVTLLDTPGHADFSAEMERVVPVLDYAVLVISGTDGVQAHTETIWRVLNRYHVPVFLFVNKMDLPGANREEILRELRQRLSADCVDFSDSAHYMEEAALCDEALLETYMETGALPEDLLAEQIARRRLFPVYFGSALKLEGITEFLSALDRLTLERVYPPEFGATVYQIGRDNQGNRLTYLKVTGGTLRVRTPLQYCTRGEETLEEKVHQIRLYSGRQFEQAEEIPAGTVCAVTGLTGTWPGQGLGAQPDAAAPMLEPVLSYRIRLPEGVDARVMLPKLRQLEEEDPMLRIVWNERLQEIHAELMGAIQIEILKSLILERFDVAVEIDSGHILYRETIADTVEGVGHFEPLRHYAEAHILLEPMEPGSGIVVDTRCSEDMLDRNWQRMVLGRLLEKQYLGVLTGSPLTDVKMTLLAGRAHLKHTEGGDFRQATDRAVRQGLMQAKSVLLEPVYRFRLEVPAEQLGRAINDIRAMSGTFQSPEGFGEMVTVTGTAPVATLAEYPTEVAAYTRGRGKLSCTPAGYAPCHNAEQVIAEMGYDPERDVEHPTGSVFCAHGAGFNVPWNQVREYMHVDTGLDREQPEEGDLQPVIRTRNLDLDEKELEAIMRREFGEIKRPQYRSAKQEMQRERMQQSAVPKKEYIIVDGYNMIFAWNELKDLAQTDLDGARNRLMDILSEYRAFRGCELVLVFDAYKVEGNLGSKFDRNKLHVVYTKENETGDLYIEKLANSIGTNYRVRVATSDALIQLSALRSGVLRISAREFEREVQDVQRQIREVVAKSGERPKKEPKPLEK